MAGVPLRGKTMAIDGEETTFAFEVNSERDLQELVAGNTDGGIMRCDGNDRWWGWYAFYGYQSAYWLNEQFTFLCSPDNTGTKAVSGTAKVSGIKTVWPVATTGYIYTIVSYVSHGALTTGQTSATDTSQPVCSSSKSLYPMFGGQSYQDYNVHYMELDFRANGMIPYVDSSTAGQVYHEDGDEDARAMWQMYTDTSADFPSAGTQGILRMYTTASTWWGIEWMRISKSPGPWSGNRKEKKLVSAEIECLFDGFTGTCQGAITAPDLTVVWS